MAFAGYFTSEEEDVLALAIFEVTQQSLNARRLLLRGLPIQISGNMPGANDPTLSGMTADVAFLDRIERLTDGTVPLRTFLGNAVRLGGMIEAMQPAREALARLDQFTTGAPHVETANLPETKEKITGGHNDMVPLAFLAGGVEAGKSVAKLEVPRFQDGQPHLTRGEQTIYLGTGWVVATGLLLTNHHVFNARNDGDADASGSDFEAQAAGTRVLFDFDLRGPAPTVVGIAELLEANKTLDYALARLTDETRSPLRIAASAPRYQAAGAPVPVNIIQHPNGDPKKYGIRNNLVTGLSETDIRYFTDTDGGSSGSPVFNDNWEVVALHRGSAFVKDVSFQGRSEAYVNVGTRIEAILADIESKRPGMIPSGG